MRNKANYTALHKPIHGFTLIELLVVIAIIALLISIVVPSLRRAQTLAQMVICSSNMQQVTYGLITYTNDNDDHMPYHPTVFNETGQHRHRPFELNWFNNQEGVVANPQSRSPEAYPYMGRFMTPYLPDSGVFNCPVSGIKDDTPWPPDTSGRPAEGTYGEFYRTGGYTPLHATYTFLWRYDNPGYGSFASFTGPARMSDSTGLVLQDSLFYLTNNTNMLWPHPQTSWFSSHRFRGAEQARPYWTQKGTLDDLPSVKLNAAYKDGHVGRFDSADTRVLQNFAARLAVTEKIR